MRIRDMFKIQMYIRLLFTLLFFGGISAKGQLPLGTRIGDFENSDIMVQPIKIVLELTQRKDSLITGATHLYYFNGK